MKKFLLLFSAVMLSLVSCSSPVFNPFGFSSNPFLDKTVISTDEISSGSSVSFSLTTDNHFNRENSVWYNSEYYSFLDERTERYPFALTLGDLTDTGVFVDEALSFVDEVKKRTSDNFFTCCVGNHDRHTRSFKWDSGDEVFTTAGCYYYGMMNGVPFLAIYKLDDSYDCITAEQFEYLEEALAKENAVYRMIIIHENVTTGSSINPTLIVFGLSSSENNRLYRIMSENGVGLILSGHNHVGNISYRLTETLGELNLSAYHRKNGSIPGTESPGRFYDFTLSSSDGSVKITSYNAETRTEDAAFDFRLPKNV